MPCKEGALSLPLNEVSVGCTGRTQSTHKILAGAADDRKVTGQKPGRQLFEKKMFWRKGRMERAYATKYQKLVGLSSSFLIY